MGTIIEFKANGKMTQGYLAPAKGGTGPGVIVLQEWWGLVDHIKKVCDRFSEAGYTTLAPDLYHGSCASAPDEAGRLMMAINIDQTEKDLRGAVHYLQSESHVSEKKLGIVGFCMGGQLALFAASKNPQIAAVADFYGIHPKVKPDLKALEASVLGIFAEKDAFVTPQVAHQLEAELKKFGKSTDFHIFPGVNHAFFNDTRPDVYNKSAADQAWKKVLEHFGKYLR